MKYVECGAVVNEESTVLLLFCLSMYCQLPFYKKELILIHVLKYDSVELVDVKILFLCFGQWIHWRTMWSV